MRAHSIFMEPLNGWEKMRGSWVTENNLFAIVWAIKELPPAFGNRWVHEISHRFISSRNKQAPTELHLEV